MTPQSKYAGVYYSFNHYHKTPHWKMMITKDGLRAQKDYPYTNKGEKQAALAYDLKRIEFGKKPVNILKKKI